MRSSTERDSESGSTFIAFGGGRHNAGKQELLFGAPRGGSGQGAWQWREGEGSHHEERQPLVVFVSGFFVFYFLPCLHIPLISGKNVTLAA